MVVKLFESEMMGVPDDSPPIRVIEVDRHVYSDVFIFESCKEKTNYLLTLEPISDSLAEEEIFSTITLFSFA